MVLMGWVGGGKPTAQQSGGGPLVLGLAKAIFYKYDVLIMIRRMYCTVEYIRTDRHTEDGRKSEWRSSNTDARR